MFWKEDHKIHSQSDKNQSFERETILLRFYLIISWPSSLQHILSTLSKFEGISPVEAFYSAMTSQTADWLKVFLSLNTLNDHKANPLCIIIPKARKMRRGRNIHYSYYISRNRSPHQESFVFFNPIQSWGKQWKISFLLFFINKIFIFSDFWNSRYKLKNSQAVTKKRQNKTKLQSLFLPAKTLGNINSDIRLRTESLMRNSKDTLLSNSYPGKMWQSTEKGPITVCRRQATISKLSLFFLIIES